MPHVGVESGVELINRLVTTTTACEFTARILGGYGVKNRPRQRAKHVRGRHQRLGVTLEYSAGIPGDPGEHWDRWPLTLEQVNRLQDARTQAGIAGGRCHPRTQHHPL